MLFTLLLASSFASEIDSDTIVTKSPEMIGEIENDIDNIDNSAEIVIELAENVNPTIQYLTEQVQIALKEGIPIASQSIEVICTQIVYLGISFLVYDLISLTLSSLGMYIGYRFVKYGIQNGDKYGPLLAPMAGGMVSILIGLLTFCINVSYVTEHLTMIFAPLIWIIQTLI